MKSIVKSMVTLGLLAVMTAVSCPRVSFERPRHDQAPVFREMVADGDIGDGTSPSKKG